MRWLGKTGLQVSELCFGTGNFAGIGHFKHSGTLTQSDANQVVNMALDAGVNFFNTAEYYSERMAEEFLGKALGSRRKDVIIISKVSHFIKKGDNTAGLSRRHIVEACEASLKRLGTDYLDIYELHGLDPRADLEITISAMNDLVHQGKVRYIGCSNYAGWNLMQGLSISEKNRWENFVTLEVMYSLVARWIEFELIPCCHDQGIAVLAYSPLHAGLLTGKYRRGHPMPEGTRITTDDGASEKWPFEQERLFTVVDEMTKIAKEHEGTVSQVALNWVLQRPEICSAIIGTRTPAQLEDNLGAMKWMLTEAEMTSLNKLTEPERQYPYARHSIRRND
jgi:aryl-alcohol dehydrogenase-like predicted oxidoreductase